MNLASFDIFDTVLVRKCGKPENIFYLLAHRLYPDNEAKRGCFIAWRKMAERLVAPHAHGREITIADIYRAKGVESFCEYTPAELIEAEKETESDNLTANPAIKAVIERCRREGKRVCFISDMYLDSRFLAGVLQREGCLTGDEKVYVSCEERARKSSGALFDTVRGYLNPAQWEHYGDHPVSDVKRARERGIKAHPVNTSYTESEKALTHNRGQQSYELSCLAGLQRTARIKQGNNAYSTLAADFVAPAYIPYVRFVFEKAKERGIKRLYFLSRDSYILQKIAECMQQDYPETELRYLFVSRKALLLPYMQHPTAEKLLAVQDKQTLKGKNVEALLNSLGTSREEVKERFSITFEYTKIDNREKERDFLDKMFGNDNSLKALQERANEKRAILNAYFAQEGLFDGKNTAMVDVGWLGTTRLMINSILKEEGHKETLFFYYGVRGDVLDKKFGEFYSYFTAQELSTELTTLVENYFSASPYPSTVGYSDKSGEIFPLFKEGYTHKENNITTANTNCATHIAKEITGKVLNSSQILKEWCIQATQNILTLKNRDIDLQPLCEAGLFDGVAFAKKLSWKELLNIMLLGGRCTAYDKASMRLTTGPALFPLAWKVCRFTGSIRRFIYLTFMQKR